MSNRWFERDNPTERPAGVNNARAPATLGQTTPGPEPPTDRRRAAATLFVLSVWAVTFVAALVLLWKYADNIPGLEDWEMVPYVTHYKAVTVSVLWEQVAEHRRPLMLSVYLALLKLTRGNFQAPLYFSVISMAGLALAMMWAARRLRGWTTFTDAFFPLALLNVQFQPMATYRGEQIFYLLPTLLAATILLIIVLKGVQLTIPTTVLAGACLVLLPLCAAPGLTYIPFFTIWFGYSGFVSWRTQGPQGRLNALLTFAFLSLALLLVCLYFVGFINWPLAARSPNLWATFTNALRFLTGSFGGGASAPIWPYSGIGIFVLLLAGITTLFTVLAWPRQTPDRSRALALLMFLGAVLTIALAMGWGRGGSGEFWPMTMYTNLAVVGLCFLYFVFMIHRNPRMGSFFQFVLLALIAIAIPFSFQAGLLDARHHHSGMQEFQRDLRNEVPIYELMGRYASSQFNLGAHGWLASRMQMLHSAGIGSFVHLQEDPEMREVQVPVVPADIKEIKWEDGTGHGTGPNSYLTFALPKPMFVAQIHIRWTYSNGPTTWPRAFWRRSDKADFPEKYQWYWSYGLEDPMTIYVADTIDQIRFHPDIKPIDFTISEITVLVPSTD
jgi:hypothetical protein